MLDHLLARSFRILASAALLPAPVARPCSDLGPFDPARHRRRSGDRVSGHRGQGDGSRCRAGPRHDGDAARAMLDRRSAPLLRGFTVVILSLALSLAIAPAALAAPCAGFSDVDDSSVFCVNVEWIKNRAVTLGCTATTYCANDAVSRLAMAAFMNRLGTALTPRSFRTASSGVTLDIDVEPRLCETGVPPSFDFPRRAFVDVAFSASAPAETTYSIDIVYRTGPSDWTALNAYPVRATVGPGQWASASLLGQFDIGAQQGALVAIRVSRGTPSGTGVLSEMTCEVRAIVHNRNGDAAPY